MNRFEKLASDLRDEIEDRILDEDKKDALEILENLVAFLEGSIDGLKTEIGE